jgi:hypothetical protein
MKLPYAPGQFAVRHAEEDAPLAASLDGIPVVCCTVHSQVAPVCAALEGLRVVYVQLPGGALPVTLSDTVRALREQALIEAAAGAGACFGGDVDCVSVWSALAWAKARGAEVVVCSIGPGVVGTATALGHGGLAAADAIGAALALGGAPILALRVSERDDRDRHRGLSHHARTILSLYPGRVHAAWPAGFELDGELPPGAELVDASHWRDECEGLPLSFMGRGPDEEPLFFAAAYAAGLLARRFPVDEK